MRLTLVRDNHFDIIFLDENMPGLTGLQTLDEIKTLDPNVSGCDDPPRAKKRILWMKAHWLKDG